MRKGKVIEGKFKIDETIKKENEEQQPNYKQWEKEFLLDMFKAYKKEPDINKRDAIKQCIREYMLADHELKSESRKEQKLFDEFKRLDRKDVMSKLEEHKIDLNDLAIVSVDTYFNETLHPYVDSAVWQTSQSFNKNVNNKFEKGEIWEYAALSKDRKSFVLLRNFLEQKVQPIEDCYVLNDATVGEKIRKDDCYIKKEAFSTDCSYVITLQDTRFPSAFVEEFEGDIVKQGEIGLDRLFNPSFNSYYRQMTSKMKEREKLYEQEQDKVHSKHADHQSLEL